MIGPKINITIKVIIAFEQHHASYATYDITSTLNKHRLRGVKCT